MVIDEPKLDNHVLLKPRGKAGGKGIERGALL